ncbi:MAG: alginate lyase family protein [Acidobacteria bacterium]|nr:alginate lyase family protein [Acidobacteriota bacterium]
MRSPREILFRLNQEAANLYLYAASPRPVLRPPSAPLSGLPDPRPVAARLLGSPFAAEVIRIAEDVLDHRFQVFGQTFDTGPQIDWRRDYSLGISSPLAYFRRVPYLNVSRVGDHKMVWELNRHPHLVALAQAWLFTHRTEFLDELFRLLKIWWAENPFQCGINWASALEVAFRGLSWTWVYHLCGHEMQPGFRERFLIELYRHGLHLEHNLSIYFSPNTHLLGEAVALHALGALFPEFPRAALWRRQGASVVRDQIGFQVLDDGAHFEQSTYYHLYAMDLVAFHHALEPLPAAFQDKLRRMADYLDAVLGPSRRLPCLGDDDGGRLFHPFGGREHFGRATMATYGQLFPDASWSAEQQDLPFQAAWWLGSQALDSQPKTRAPASSRHFPHGGLIVMTNGPHQILMDCGPFGHAGAGHSHSDTLSLVVRRGEQDILIDPGACTYVAGKHWREWFRGSAAHNILRWNFTSQANPSGPFRWIAKPEVELRNWTSTAEMDYADAISTSRPFAYRRRALFLKTRQLLLVLDELTGPLGEHDVEQFWHLGSLAAHPRIRCFPANAEPVQGGEHGWRSPVFGSKEPAYVLLIQQRCPLPVCLAAAIDLDDAPAPQADLSLVQEGNVLRLCWKGRGVLVQASFQPDGPPEVA